MKKKTLKTLLTIVVLLALGTISVIYFSLNGNPISDYQMTKETKFYLLEHGYVEEEISLIEASYNPKHNTKRFNGTIAYVTFSDEPEERYLYLQRRDSDQIQQHCEYYSEEKKSWETDYIEERKHMDKNCTIKN